MQNQSPFKFFAFLCFSINCTSLFSQIPNYSITDLGEWRHEVHGLSTNGTVVGTNALGVNNLPERWNGATWDSLPLMPGDVIGTARQVSSNGMIVGSSAPALGSGFAKAVTWDNGVLAELNIMGGGIVGSNGYSISSESGHISGNVVRGFGLFSGFVRDSNGTLIETGTLAGHNQATQNDVNNLGRAAGDSRFSGLATERGTYYSVETGLVDLGVLSGLDHSRSTARALNDSGIVVGWSWRSLPSSDSRAYFWSEDMGMVGIGDSTFSQANDINNLGWIVGRHGTDEADSMAFLFRSDLGLFNLQTLLDPASNGWSLQQATAIDSSGRIIGYGLNPDGVLSSWLATPLSVPEPSPISVLSAVFLLGLLVRWPRYRCPLSAG